MKRTEKKRRRSRLLIIVNIVLLCAFTTATFSWFIFDKSASVQGEGNMSIMAGSGLEIYYDGSWNSQHQISTSMMTYPDITGDGVDFYCPIVLDTYDETLEDPSTFTYVNDTDEKDKYYITVDLKFRTSNAVKVYLSNESEVIGPNINTPVQELPDGNKALSGNHSRDGIAGAVRVAFVENVNSTEPSAKIWIPNDTYELIETQSGTSFSTISDNREVFTSVTTVLNEEKSVKISYPYGYQKKSGDKMKSFYWSDLDYCNGKVVVGNNLASVADENTPAMVNDATPILDFTDNEDGRVQEKSVSIRIWVEGTDREADKALLGGMLQYKFKFISFEKPENENEGTLDSIRYNSESRTFYSAGGNSLQGLQYSFNGIDWYDYSSAIDKVLIDKFDDIHVRFKETTAYKRSSVRTFSFITS